MTFSYSLKLEYSGKSIHKNRKHAHTKRVKCKRACIHKSKTSAAVFTFTNQATSRLPTCPSERVSSVNSSPYCFLHVYAMYFHRDSFCTEHWTFEILTSGCGNICHRTCEWDEWKRKNVSASALLTHATDDFQSLRICTVFERSNQIQDICCAIRIENWKTIFPEILKNASLMRRRFNVIPGRNLN